MKMLIDIQKCVKMRKYIVLLCLNITEVMRSNRNWREEGERDNVRAVKSVKWISHCIKT